MKPTEILVDEHDIIKRAIKVLEAVDRRFEAGDDSVAAAYPPLIDFIREFADRCHHGKEEDILFKLLERRGMPRMGPIGVMMIEHDHGRDFVQKLSEATDRFMDGDSAARIDVTKNADGYASLLKGHIDKENGILYPMADNMLSQADQIELAAQFDGVEEEIGRGRHQEYERLIDDLERRFGSV